MDFSCEICRRQTDATNIIIENQRAHHKQDSYIYSFLMDSPSLGSPRAACDTRTTWPLFIHY
jgi:hypothetical protein